MTDIQLIQCSDQDLEELKRLALACRATSDDDHAFGLALDEYDQHANPDQVLMLFEKIDQLTGKVGNMVGAERQMGEELEIARDDLVIFKSSLSALGEASKKLVVCARTSGGTAGPDQGLMDACAGVEGVITLAGVARAMNEFERVTAERDALQLSLTTADERNDTISIAYLRAGEREHELRKEIVQLRAALKFYADSDHYSTDDGMNWDSCSGEPANILWHESEPWFIEDGSIARAVLAQSVEAADQEEAQQCLFPQSCTTRCDCDIPDFSPGNGNKARRRAETILGFKVVEDPTMAPDTIQLCICNQGRLPCTCKSTELR